MADEKELIGYVRQWDYAYEKLPGYVRHWADAYKKLHGETPTIYRRGSWWTLNGVKCQKGNIWIMTSHIEWQIRQMEWEKLCSGGPQ